MKLRRKKQQKGEGVFKGKNRQTSKQKVVLVVSDNGIAGFSTAYKKKIKRKGHQKGGSVRRIANSLNPGIAGHRIHPRIHPPFRSTNPYQIQKGGTATYDPNWDPTGLSGFGRPIQFRIHAKRRKKSSNKINHG